MNNTVFFNKFGSTYIIINFTPVFFQYHMAPRNSGMADRNEDAEGRDEEAGIDNPENEIRRDLPSRTFNVNRYSIILKKR
jgi:hypothetical protein